MEQSKEDYTVEAINKLIEEAKRSHGTLKERFLKGFDNPEYEGVLVACRIPGCPDFETIINPQSNFSAKKEYYNKAYNDDLELIANPKIKIVEWAFQDKEGKNHR